MKYYRFILSLIEDDPHNFRIYQILDLKNMITNNSI